ncbi:MAG: metallopeptidase TldD-related protein [Myxococcota bacterium]|nr:metallopeptidase TldD-related protein [Myxococcota bacterium]
MSIPRPSGPSGAYFEQMGVTAEVVRRVLSAALSRGGQDCDLYFQHSAATTVSLTDGKVSQAGTHVDLGMGVRVVVGDQVGYSYSEDLSADALIAAARAAAEIAGTDSSRSPQPLRIAGLPDYYPVVRPWETVDMGGRVALVRDWEQRAFASDNRVKRVNAYLSDAASIVMIVRPDGRLVEDWRPMTSAFVQCTVEENNRRESNNYNVAARAGLEFYSEDRQARMVREAVERSTFQLAAGKPQAGEMPVVLAAGPSAILLHEAIGHGMEADFNRKKISIFSDKMGKRIANEHITIVDDGTIAASRGAINIDDEGNASERTVLVEEGVLRSYLHDEISARHFGVDPTGSGRRQSFRHAPLPRMRATVMENGPHTPEEIIASVDRGIYCISFGNGQVNIGGGDFAFYMKHGYLIENGKLTKPIKDVNIIGNGPEALARVEMVGNDLKIDEGGWTCGKDGQGVPVSQGMPTVKVSSLVVGGVG